MAIPAGGLPDATLGSLIYMVGNTTYLLPPPSQANDGSVLHSYAAATDNSGLLWSNADLTCTASGAYAHAEGYGSIASGAYSHAEGYETIAQGQYSHAEGYVTHAYGAYSHAEGGFHTHTESNYAHAEGYQTSAVGQMAHSEGYNSTATGNSSHAGGSGGNADLLSKWARADAQSYATENTGPSQTGIIQLSARTVDATPTNLTIGGGAGGTPVLPVVRSNSTYGFEVKIVGRDISGVDHLWAIRRGLIHNEAGTTALAGSIGPASPADIGTTGGLSWSVAITADATNNAIQVQVTGAASTTIHWSCSLQTVEVG